MVNLPDEHPGLHRYFQQGGFVVKLTSEPPFASIQWIRLLKRL